MEHWERNRRRGRRKEEQRVDRREERRSRKSGTRGQTCQHHHDSTYSDRPSLLQLGEGLSCREKHTILIGEEGLDGSDAHHANHHNGEEGDAVACHPEHKEIQGQLLPRAQGY